MNRTFGNVDENRLTDAGGVQLAGEYYKKASKALF